MRKILSSNESQMKGIREAGPELQATLTPPCLTSRFICKWRLTLICCVKPQKKKEKKKKTTFLLYKVRFLLRAALCRITLHSCPLKAMEQFPPSRLKAEFPLWSACLPSYPVPCLVTSRITVVSGCCRRQFGCSAP